MHNIIGPDNKVNYGCIDGPVNFNYQDFILKNFSGKTAGSLKKRFTFHKFNYMGIISNNFLIGIGTVSLGYAYNVFVYYYDYEHGIVYEFDRKGVRDGKTLIIPPDPDVHTIKFSKRKNSLKINKSFNKNSLEVDLDFENRLTLNGVFSYGLKSHNPLRVLNPSEPTLWTFTEKCSPLLPESLSIVLDGKEADFDIKKTAMLYDWTGGYLRRKTDWYWAAFAGTLSDKNRTTIGLNLAALVNESFYSENAFWINNKRTRVQRCIYDYHPEDPYRPWHIWDEAGTVDITFIPKGERKENFNVIVAKTIFRQFVGTFEGTLKPEGGKPVKFSNIHGFTELHRAKW